MMVAATAAPASAATDLYFDIPGGSLADALVAVGRQARVSLSASDPRLQALRTKGLKGRYSLKQALQRLLDNTGYGFAFVDATTIQLIRFPESEPPKVKEATLALAPAPSMPPPEIIVTASKQGATLAQYPGSVSIVDLSDAEAARNGRLGSEAIIQRLPNLASTSLGSGRNKIFIRGIADSSFNGPSQATISQYMGETRLIYSAPDPDLSLYDIKRIEVLEGPQGTLYGAGSLGGIIRLVPNAPDLDSVDGSAAVGLATTQNGGASEDLSAIVNVPIKADRLGLRLVGYRSRASGYIDDSLRGLRNINRTDITGLRGTLRLKTESGWTVDFAGILQNTGSRDSQYAERDQSPLTRRAAIAQPFDNDYRLADITAAKTFGTTDLVSATGFARHTIGATFDATTQPGISAPRRFIEDMSIWLLSHETRLSGSLGSSAHWVGGISLVNNVNRISRVLGPFKSETPIAGVRNRILDLAAFGELQWALTPRILLTTGVRFSLVRQDGGRLDTSNTRSEPHVSNYRILPTVALAWHPHRDWLLYARYQQGFRPGGLDVSGSGSTLTSMHFRSDEIYTAEAGLRFGQSNTPGISGSVSGSHARWHDIQADLIDVNGFPFTANIGSGRINNVAATLNWRPVANLSFEAAGFVNASALVKPAPMFAAAQDRDLPNISDAGWRLATRYEFDISGAAKLTLDGSLRFIGESTLAIGQPLNLPQGNFYNAVAGARLDFGRWGLSLDAQNLTNSRGNRFSYGNPFSVADGKQVTPLRPRTIRLGLDARF